MSPKRTPRGQEPPPNTVHNLAKPPKLEKPLPAGIDLDALHGGTHQSRIARYRRGIRILEKLIEDDDHLAGRVKAALDATFPSGNGAEGARSTDISDPTGGAATSGRVKDAAERTWDSADAALKALWWAEGHRQRAAKNSASETPEAQELFATRHAQLTGKQPEPEVKPKLCGNCAKIGVKVEAGQPPDVPKDCELCTYCWQVKRDYGIEPSREILRKHYDKGRVYRHEYERMVREAREAGRLPVDESVAS